MRVALLVVLVAGCAKHSDVVTPAPDVRVTIRMPGASPETLEHAVAEPVEHALAAHVRTAIRDGIVTFDITGSDVAKVRQALAMQSRTLPPGIDPPDVASIRGERIAVRYLARGKKHDAAHTKDLYDPLDVVAANHAAWVTALEQTPGIARIDVCGERPAMRTIDIDAARMAAFGVSMQQIREPLEAAPAGDGLGTIEIGTFANQPIHLGDVAIVQTRPSRPGCVASDRSGDAIIGTIWTQSSADLAKTISAAAPSELDIQLLDPTTTELVVECPDATMRERRIAAALRAVQDRRDVDNVFLEDDGSVLHVLVPKRDVESTLVGLRQIPDCVVHRTDTLVVGLHGPDRAQLAAAAHQIEQLLGAKADGIIGIATHNVTRVDVRDGANANAARDAFAMTTDDGLRLACKTPTILRVIGADFAQLHGIPNQPLADITTISQVQEPLELRRADGQPWVGVRALGTAAEIEALVAKAHLPAGVRWQLER